MDRVADLSRADKERLLAAKKTVLLKEAYKRNPLLWIEKQVKTFDEHDEITPVKPMPLKPYFKTLVEAWQTESVLIVPKSRQMMISWLFVSLILHEAQFYPFRLEAVFSKKEDDAFQLVERAKFIYTNQSSWLKTMCPLDRKMRDMPLGHLFFDHGSKLRGLAQGKDQVRSFVPTTSLIDEAAFQDKLEETFNACIPCSKRIVLVSSANTGFFERLCADESVPTNIQKQTTA